jgi:hypothetical protein
MSAYEGFPKFYSHPSKPNRVAHTPVDAVNLESYGYKLNETKAAEKTLAEVDKANEEAKAAADTAKTEANKPKPAAPKS